MSENPNELEHHIDNEELEKVIPSMNVTVPAVQEQESIIGDAMLLGIYSEILDTIRQDRVEVADILNNFCEMVMNQGDSSSASKEAIVNLVRTKLDAADKMAKVADLMTRVKLKEKDTFPKYLNQTQENTIHIGQDRKELLKRLNAAQKKSKKKEGGNGNVTT
jgi:hypothetical protein